MDLTKFGYREGFNKDNRFNLKSNITLKNGTTYLISTVDLGLDHSYIGGPPLYYETMIFVEGDWMELYCERYTTEEQAAKGHEQIFNALRNRKYRIGEYGFEFKEVKKNE